jgi:hypothetical protein
MSGAENIMAYRLRSLAALVMTVLLGSAGVAAQERAPAPAREIETAPPGWSFTPNIAIGWLYDSNVRLADPGFNQEPQDDQLFLFVPSGELMYLGKYSRFVSGYRGTVLRYRTIDALDTYDQRAWGSLSRRFSPRVTLFGNGSFQHSPTTDDLLLDGVVFSRTGTEMTNLNGGLDFAVTKATNFHTRYEWISVDFDREETRVGVLRAGRSQGAETEVTHRLNNRFSIGGVYDVRFADINRGAEGSPLLDPATLQFHNAGVTAAVELGPSTTLSGAGGIAVLNDSRRPELALGPFVRLALSHQARRASMKVEYFRMAVPSFGFVVSSMSEGLRGSVAMPVYRNRVYVQANGYWRRTDPLEVETFELDTLQGRTTVGVALARAVRVEGFYLLSRQDSRADPRVHPEGGVIVRHRVGAQLVFGMPMRIQ